MIDTKTVKYFQNVVQLLLDEDEVFSSLSNISLNPNITLVKFILTDDKPNGNNVRIPREEFPNLISSGLYMPIKMEAEGPGNHEDSLPIGVITHLKEAGDKIRGIGVLWNRERPLDVDLIKERYSKNKPLDISWEIVHKESSIDEKGIENLIGVYLRAATLVSIPAYGGRTPITEVESLSSKDEDTEDKTLDELKKQITLLEKSLEDKESELKKALEKISKLEENQVTAEISKELEDLRKFKETAEAEQKLAERKKAIRSLFEEKGVEKDEEYFEKNEAMLLDLSDDVLNFVIEQEIKLAEASKEEENEEEEEQASTKVPNLKGGQPNDEDEEVDIDNASPKELGRLLREQRAANKEGGRN